MVIELLRTLVLFFFPVLKHSRISTFPGAYFFFALGQTAGHCPQTGDKDSAVANVPAFAVIVWEYSVAGTEIGSRRKSTEGLMLGKLEFIEALVVDIVLPRFTLP